MYKTQQLLLAFLTTFFATTLFAQIKANIDITGIDKPLEDNVRLLLSVEQQKDHQYLSEGRLHRLHEKAPQEITKALQPFGYYRPIINSTISNISTQQSPALWQLHYTVDPGPPLPIGKLDFILKGEMRNDPEIQKIIKNIPLQEGRVFNHIEYDNFKTSLARIASERGYFNASFIEHRVEINLDSYQADVRLVYDGGARYRFTEPSLNQAVLDAELLQRYIPFEAGTPYSLNLLIELQQVLNDSYYFQTVEISPGEPLHDSHEIPINVKLTPRKRHRFSLGLGFGTDTGARGKFGWEMPRINSRGHRFDSNIQLSQIGYNITANYRVPIYNPRTDQLIYSAGIVNETIDDRESTLRSLGVSLKHRRKEWRETISLNYQREDFVVGEDSGRSNLLIPGINWSRTWGDNFIYALDGFRFDLDLRGANRALVSDNDFAQLQGSIKFITSFGNRNRFITRGTLGSTWSDEFHELPSSLRFFAGGAQSVRGYSYKSLGPVDINGDVIGGKYLLAGSIEYEHMFLKKWGLAIFYDAGNAIDDLNDDLEKGVGFGLRWKSPVGTIRIDMANALSLDGNPWRLHIDIGPDL